MDLELSAALEGNQGGAYLQVTCYRVRFKWHAADTEWG